MTQLIILLICATLLFLALALHDLVHIPPLTNVHDLKRHSSTRRLLLDATINGLCGAVPLFLLFYYGAAPPLWALRTIISFYSLLLLGALCSWWVPYFFGSPEAHRQAFAKFSRTHHFLPHRGENVRPNTFHVLLHVLMLACLVLVLTLPHQKAYPVTKVHSYQECSDILAPLGEQDLVLFDVDDTLMCSPDALANIRKSDLTTWFRLKLFLKFPTRYTSEAWLEPLSYMLQSAQRTLIEPVIPVLIADLQKRGVPVLALTSMESGGCGAIESFPEWRRSTLLRLGVEFTVPFDDATFTMLPQHRGTYPCLYKGALCTNQLDKGLVLAAFLDHFQMNPSRIVFFDDLMIHLQEVGAVCAKRGIPCTLVHYRHVDLLPNTFDHGRAIKQLERLVTHREWLPDSCF